MTNMTAQINRNKSISWVLFPLSLFFIVFLLINPCTAENRENNVVRAVRQISPAVVNISSEYEIRKKSKRFSGYGMDPMLENFFREFFSPELQRREKRSSLGSGVIIDGERGYVLTNNHVIEKASAINIFLNDQREFSATIVGMDPESDLAVLKIESETPLPSVQMGDSDDIMIGESVIAIGNPFGFSHTVTTGVISAINRSIKTDDRVFHQFIQTDASINPGNSGGPLLNINGELIGINTAIYAQAQGIGFAIPINRAKKIISDLINYGQVVQAWIGILVQPIDPNLAAYLGMRETNGVMVTEVEQDSPAEKANIKEGDIIIAISDHKITDYPSFQHNYSEIVTGQTVTIDIQRDGKVLHRSLKASVFPLERALDLADRLLGISVADLDEQIRSKYAIYPRQGVLITELRRNSNLDRIGVRPGDTIHQIDEKKINDISDFKTAIIKYRNKPSVVLMIQRDRQLYYINASMKDTR